jgi:hypothetical protein
MSVKKEISNVWKDVPSPIRGGVYIVAIGGIAYLGYKWYRKMQLDAKVQEIKDKIDAYAKVGIKQSYSDAQYKAWHDTILKEGNSLNTNEEVIYNIFRKIKNQVDFDILDSYTYTIGYLFKETYTLQEFMHARLLDPEEIDVVNRILKTSRIDFQFERE